MKYLCFRTDSDGLFIVHRLEKIDRIEIRQSKNHEESGLSDMIVFFQDCSIGRVFSIEEFDCDSFVSFIVRNEHEYGSAVFTIHLAK